jgi:hypothetical protein
VDCTKETATCSAHGVEGLVLNTFISYQQTYKIKRINVFLSFSSLRNYHICY